MSRPRSNKLKTESVEDESTIKVEREGSVNGSPMEGSDHASSNNVKKEDPAGGIELPSSAASKLKSSRSPSTSSLARIKLHADEPAKAEVEGSVSPVKSETKTPKMGRSQSSKGPPPRVAPLFDHLPDVTSEATSSFTVIDASSYQNKYLGYTESALECDCSEEWGTYSIYDNCHH
jgi:[histone H3]-lysine36 N-trimethyltransferase